MSRLTKKKSLLSSFLSFKKKLFYSFFFLSSMEEKSNVLKLSWLVPWKGFSSHTAELNVQITFYGFQTLPFNLT
jgi:hypothetical protein